MTKISIIGAGNVGATLAERVLKDNLADVALIDIEPELARGKAYDLRDSSSLVGYKRGIVGSGNYEDTAGSKAVVVTAGFPRKPGMTRDDLIRKNREIICSVISKIKAHSPDSILVIVTNPLDIMTYLAYRESGINRRRIIGMAGNLDTSRFKAILSEKLSVGVEKIESYVLGSHGDTMVPLISRTTVGGKPLKELLGDSEIEDAVKKTKKRGGEIVGLLKSGSAYFSPSAACLEILRSISTDDKKTIPCSCVLEGEYGLKGLAVGVPAKIGSSGISEIVEWNLAENELRALKESANAVSEAIGNRL